jgi:hypothetical protein
MIYHEIPTKAEYWGDQTTGDEALRAAEALQLVLRRAAELLGIDAEITLSPDGNDDFGDDDGERSVLSYIHEAMWIDNAIQAAAYEETPINPDLVLKRYNRYVRHMGGVGHHEFESI